MIRRSRGSILLLLVGLASCGGDPVIAVEVDLSAFEVPREISLLHLVMRDDRGNTLGHDFTLEAEQDRPIVELWRGPRTSSKVTVQAHVFLGTDRVSSSAERAVEFRPGETTEVTLLVPHP